jgi:D-alanyl-D-alanine dipeptidase
MNDMATLADTKVTSISIVENNEILVQIPSNNKRLVLDTSMENQQHLGYEPIFKLRESTLRNLILAAETLPDDYGFLVKECFRPVHIQALYFYRYVERLRLIYSDLSQEQLHQQAARYVAPPECASHATGGAIDLTLIRHDGEFVDFGTSYDAAPDDCGNACFFDADGISEHAKSNRSLLKRALGSSGFVNYPYEWWHWSYGDKFWAFANGAKHAHYGPLGQST